MGSIARRGSVAGVATWRRLVGQVAAPPIIHEGRLHMAFAAYVTVAVAVGGRTLRGVSARVAWVVAPAARGWPLARMRLAGNRSGSRRVSVGARATEVVEAVRAFMATCPLPPVVALVE